jgi:hypothetical protein
MILITNNNNGMINVDYLLTFGFFALFDSEFLNIFWNEVEFKSEQICEAWRANSCDGTMTRAWMESKSVSIFSMHDL